MKTLPSFRVLFEIALCIGIVGFLSATLTVPDREGLRLISPSLWQPALFISVCGFFLGVLLRAFQSDVPRRYNLPLFFPRPWVFVFSFLLLLLSDYVFRPFGFYSQPNLRLQLFSIGTGSFILLSALFYNPRWVQNSSQTWLPPLLLFFIQSLLALSFLNFADGRLLFSDDHPSFLYRLNLLKDHFPAIPFYNPQWNAGYSAREFFASGILNVYFLSYPLVEWWLSLSTLEGAAGYNWIIVYLFLFLSPWSIYFAARNFGRTPIESLLAAVLSFVPSLGFLEWLLKFGTIGFCLSAMLLPLCVALSARLAFSPRLRSWWNVPLLLVLSFCTITWTLSLIGLLPLAFLGLLKLKTVLCFPNRAKVLTFFVLFITLNAPWVAVFFDESSVMSFVSGNVLPGTSSAAPATSPEPIPLTLERLGDSLSAVMKATRPALSKVNPLLLCVFLPGLFILKRGVTRTVLSATIFWLLLIGAFGEFFKPQLELRRMLLPAAIFMCIPAAVFVRAFVEAALKELNVLRSHGEFTALQLKVVYRVFGAVLLLGATGMTVLVADGAYCNKSDEHYQFAPLELHSLSEAIAKHGGRGRTFFVGFILHELGARAYDTQDGGHVAPLPIFSGKPMYASDFYHSRWQTIDPIPKPFRARGSEGVEEFLDLVNATAVVTFKREWAAYCQNNPRYKEVYFEGRFRLFVREQESPSYFLEGAGSLEQLPNGIVVTPTTDTVVLKFRHHKKLKATPATGVELSPEYVFDEDTSPHTTAAVNFIRLKISPELLAQGAAIKLTY